MMDVQGRNGMKSELRWAASHARATHRGLRVAQEHARVGGGLSNDETEILDAAVDAMTVVLDGLHPIFIYLGIDDGGTW